MRTFQTCKGGLLGNRFLRSKPLAPVGRPNLKYDAKQLEHWCRNLDDYVSVINTEEFQAQMRYFLADMAEEILPRYTKRRDYREGIRHAMAAQMDLRLQRMYPGIEKFGEVVYRRHGGPGSPGARFIFQPRYGSKGRELEVVIGQYVERSRKASVHSLRLKANTQYIQRWKAIKAAPKSGVLFIERYSGYDGFQKAKAVDPTIRLDSVVNGKLHVIACSRKRTLLAQGAVLKALERYLPAKVVFRNPDRLGREYYLASFELLDELGIEVEFEDYVQPSGHCRPWRSEIQQDNKKLDGFLFVHRSKLKGVPRRVAECAGKIRDWYLIKREHLLQLGVAVSSSVDLHINRFGNCLVDLARIVINGDRKTYLIHAPP